MEWDLCTASSDSEDDAIDNEERAPSSTGQKGSLYGVAEQSSTKDALGSIESPFIKKTDSTGSDWESMDSKRAEAREKPSCTDIQDLVHIEKKDGNKLSVPRYMHYAVTVNISEEQVRPPRQSLEVLPFVKRGGGGWRTKCRPVSPNVRSSPAEEDGTSDNEPEVLPMQTMDEVEEQVLVTQEDSEEELEFESSTAEFGVSLTLNPKASEEQRKKRHLAEDGTGNAYKLAKTEQPEKNQMPGASAECEESASDPTQYRWFETFQASHLEGSYAADEPIDCAESTEALSHSSELAEDQNEKYPCAECDMICKSADRLYNHVVKKHRKPFKCPDCGKGFDTEQGMSGHHVLKHRTPVGYDSKPFKCPDCNKGFSTANGMRDHHLLKHNVGNPLQCTVCRAVCGSPLGVRKHMSMAHNVKTQLY